MFGMIISTVTQLSISGLLAIELSNNVIISAAVGVITGASFIIPKIIDRTEKKRNILSEDMKMGINQTRALLSCA